MDGLLLDTEGIYTEVTQQIVGEYGKVFDWSIKEKIIGRRSIQAAEIIVEVWTCQLVRKITWTQGKTFCWKNLKILRPYPVQKR